MTNAESFVTEDYKTIDFCRVCGSNQLTDLFSLGEQYVSNFLRKDEPEGIKVPIDVVLCKKCSLVQMLHTAPQELLYRRFYWYKSSVTETMKKALRDITLQAESRAGLAAGDTVLDIGSNDGTLLRSYQIPGLFTVGVEPATNLALEGSKGISIFINDFWTADVYWHRVGKSAKVITAIGMFYDCENPNQFIADISRHLREDGIFIAQLMCLSNMLDQFDVGNLCHEHLSHFSLRSLIYLYQRHGLEIFDIEINNTNGKSYRVYAQHSRSRRHTTREGTARILATLASEEPLDKSETYQKWFKTVEDNKQRTVQFIRGEVEHGKTCWVLGASTKGNVILQWYGLDHTLITGASERSQEKWGKYTIGTRIPIYSEQYARAANPSYFLCLPYAFREELLQRESQWRSDGGKFIFPLPVFEVV